MFIRLLITLDWVIVMASSLRHWLTILDIILASEGPSPGDFQVGLLQYCRYLLYR